MASLDKEKLLEALRAYAETDLFSQRLDQLKNYDFNPFRPPANPDGPEGWDKVVEAGNLVNEIIKDVVGVVEKVVRDAGEVGLGNEKREAVVQFLDDIIKLPFWAEPFDKPLIRLLVDQIVGLLNKLLGKDWITKIPDFA